MNYSAESSPPETMKDLIDSRWVSFKNVPKPTVIVSNDATDPYIRFNLNDGADIIIIYQSGPEMIKYRGNISYYDKSFPLQLDIWTKQDRQRLRDIWKEIKGIIFDHLFGFTGYQIIRIKGYTEMVNDSVNVWKGQVKLSVDAAGVCVETNGSYDRYTL
jgi:hypothetical protein